MNEQPHWMQVLVMTLGELAFLVIGIPLYIFLVLPNHPEGALPGIVPVIGEGVDPAHAILVTVMLVVFCLAIVYALSKTVGIERFLVDEVTILVEQFTVVDFIPIFLAAGIGEEFLFRVALVEPLGITIPALLFTAMHIAYWKKPLILLYVFVFGLLMGAFYLHTGSFLLCALAHAIYNFVLSCLMKSGIIPVSQPADA